MNNRREFLKSAAALAGAPAILSARSPNEVLGIAAIGVGTRGHQLLSEAQACANTEIRIIADLYDGHIARARELTKNSSVRVTKDWQEAVDSKDVDAVLVATPDFWHAPMTIRAAENKKHIYVEKGLCLNLKEAKAMRAAVKKNGVVLQLGHHYNSIPTVHKARELYNSGTLGKVPVIRMFIDRTNSFPEWQFYGWYTIQQPPADANAATIDWDRFVANAPKRPFDVERFFRWRCFWDYGTGIAGDLMSHMWDAANMISGAGIPETVQTMGSLYFWKHDREVPDQWHVMFDYPAKELSMVFNCTFASRHSGEMLQVLGHDKTMDVSAEYCRTFEGEWKQDYLQNKRPFERRQAAKIEMQPQDAPRIPEYSMKPGELTVSGHMQNFIDCIRSGETPRCGVDRAFEEGAVIAMAMESYRRKRIVRWNARTEEIETV